MHLMIEVDAAAVAKRGAELLCNALRRSEVRAIQLATGSSPQALYALVPGRLGAARAAVARRITVYQMDEYLGIGPDDERSLYEWMRRSFTEPLGVPRERVIPLLEGRADPDVSCRRFDTTLQTAGGLDVVVAGLGPNGHLGFNEPPSDPLSPSRIIDLAPESVQSNAAYWGGVDRVPRRAATTGLRAMLGARAILVVVTGAHKRAILERTLLGLVSNAVPSSFLQQSPQAVILADRIACDPETERRFCGCHPAARTDELPLLFRP